MKRPPCKKDGKDCPLRKPACSASCGEFQKWHMENVQKPNEIRARERIANAYLVSDIQRRKERARKSKKPAKASRET